MEAKGNEVVGVGDLALEVFLHIMAFLEPAYLVRVEAVQRAWAHTLRHDDHTWRTVFRAHLGQGPSRPTTPAATTRTARGSWRSRCVKAARRAHETANRADLTPEARALELLKVACGLHRVCARVLADIRSHFGSAGEVWFDYAGSGQYPLHLAVASGSTATVEVLAEAGFNVHQRNASGVTPIGAAVQTGQLDLVEVLLRYGASSEELAQLTGTGSGGGGAGAPKGKGKGKGKLKSKNTIPILHQAAAAGHTRMVQVLLDLARQGKGTFHRDSVGAGAEGGSKDETEDDGKDEGDGKYLNVADRFGNTPLQLAVEKNREAMIRFLVSKGADVNHVHSTTRLTPLHWAVKHNKVATARLLLELGAANEPVEYRKYLVTVPPFFMACEHQLPDMVELFLEHFGPGIIDAVVPSSGMGTPLLRVLHLGQCRKDFVQFLLAKGANVRATTGGPHTNDALTCLLQVLSEKRCKPSAEIVALLELLIDAIGLPMAHRVDLLETTAGYFYEKESAVETEEHFKHLRAMVDLLVAKGVQVPRGQETDIVATVARHGSVDMVRFFIDKGVHIDARQPASCPTLKMLLDELRSDKDTERIMALLEFFLENGADPNVPDYKGETPCFWVGKRGQALELLVKHGADVNLTNQKGHTALTELLYQLHELNLRYYYQTTFDELADIARLLVRLGADPKQGGNPYRRILREVCSRPAFAPEWLALVAELGVPIDTKSPPRLRP